MAFLTCSPQNSVLKTSKQRGSSKRHKQACSWDQIKNVLSCKYIQTATAPQNPLQNNINATLTGAYAKLGHCKYIGSFKDVVDGNTKVIHRPDKSTGNSSSGRETGRKNVSGVSLSSSRSLASNASGRSNSFSTSSRRMQFRKLSGCYECHMIVDPSSRRYPNPTSTICCCPECAEIFSNTQSLELHQAVTHAVMDDMRDMDDMLSPHVLDDIEAPTITWDNQYHVRDDVWDGGGREALETYCGNQRIRDWKLRKSQRGLL